VKKLKAKHIEISAKLGFLQFIRQEDASALQDNDRLGPYIQILFRLFLTQRTTEAQNAADKAELQQYKDLLEKSFSRVATLAREVEAERRLVQKEVKEGMVLAKEVSEMRLELLRLGRDVPVEDVRPPNTLNNELCTDYTNALQRLTITAAEEVLENQIAHMQDLDTQLREVQEVTAAAKEEVKLADEDLQTVRPVVAQAKAALQAEASKPKEPGDEAAQSMSKLFSW
jgi:hypothetical protein